MCPLLSGSEVSNIVVFWSWWNPFWFWWNPFWSRKLSWQFRRLNLGWFLVKRELSKVRILCFKFSFNPLRFSLMRETDTKWPETKAEQLAKLQFLNDKIDQSTNFAKSSSVKWLFLYKFTWYLQLLSFWLFFQFLLWEKIWENWEKIKNTKSEPNSFLRILSFRLMSSWYSLQRKQRMKGIPSICKSKKIVF